MESYVEVPFEAFSWVAPLIPVSMINAALANNIAATLIAAHAASRTKLGGETGGPGQAGRQPSRQFPSGKCSELNRLPVSSAL